MEKTLNLATVSIITFLLTGGLLFPEHPSMWLAGISTAYHIVYVLLLVIFTILFMSDPPRSKSFRMVLGGSAAILTTTTLFMTFYMHMPILNAFVFMQSAVIFGIAALEPKTAQKPVTQLQ